MPDIVRRGCAEVSSDCRIGGLDGATAPADVCHVSILLESSCGLCKAGESYASASMYIESS